MIFFGGRGGFVVVVVARCRRLYGTNLLTNGCCTLNLFGIAPVTDVGGFVVVGGGGVGGDGDGRRGGDGGGGGDDGGD